MFMAKCDMCEGDFEKLNTVILPEDKKTKKKSKICDLCEAMVYDPDDYEEEEETVESDIIVGWRETDKIM
jgi:hypothetical protein